MKTFFWVIVLATVAYFLYRRAHVYGFPWESQVAIASYESNRRSMSGNEELYVFGEVENRTRKRVQATVQCKALPGGMTLASKSGTEVVVEPLERVPFDLSLAYMSGTTGAECRILEWNVEGGLEERATGAVMSLFRRIKALF